MVRSNFLKVSMLSLKKNQFPIFSDTKKNHGNDMEEKWKAEICRGETHLSDSPSRISSKETLMRCNRQSEEPSNIGRRLGQADS